jgi:hypothetical protein
MYLLATAWYVCFLGWYQSVRTGGVTLDRQVTPTTVDSGWYDLALDWRHARVEV